MRRRRNLNTFRDIITHILSPSEFHFLISSFRCCADTDGQTCGITFGAILLGPHEEEVHDLIYELSSFSSAG